MTGLPSRNRPLARIIVEAALDLAADPAGLDVLHQQRTRAVFGIGQALVQHLHHRQAGIEADEVGELERAHRMVGAELHAGVDRLDIADALVERVDRLVDHRQHEEAKGYAACSRNSTFTASNGNSTLPRSSRSTRPAAARAVTSPCTA